MQDDKVYVDTAFGLFKLAYQRFTEDKDLKDSFHYQWAIGVADIAARLRMSDKIQEQRTTVKNNSQQRNNQVNDLKPTDAQLKTIKEIAQQLGITPDHPKTRSEASSYITALLKRKNRESQSLEKVCETCGKKLSDREWEYCLKYELPFQCYKCQHDENGEVNGR